MLHYGEVPQGHVFAGLMGQLFLDPYFTQSLKEVLQYCNLDENRYQTHSFRIGGASWVAAKGMSDSQMRVFGRWNSNAFLQYIHIPTLTTKSRHNLPIGPSGLTSYMNCLHYVKSSAHFQQGPSVCEPLSI